LAVIVREAASPHPSRFVNGLHETHHHPDLPDYRYFPEFLGWVEAYHERVARPRVAADVPGIPDDDWTGLSGLAP
jgi:hypothetical protein